MKKSSKIFVGMDVHRKSIDISLAEPAGEVRRRGEVGGEQAALAKAGRKLFASHLRLLQFALLQPLSICVVQI